MAGQHHPRTSYSEEPTRYQEARLYRAVRRSPLRPLRRYNDHQNVEYIHVAARSRSSNSQSIHRSQVEDSNRRNGASGAQFVQELIWPPKGVDIRSKLSHDEAEAFVGNGTASFKGFAFQTPNVPFRHSRFYAFAGMKDGEESLEAFFKPSPLITEMSLALSQESESLMPWETLEQPSMTMCFGSLPGTITLNYWVGLAVRALPPSETTSNILVWPLELKTILDRLEFLEYGLDKNTDSLEKFLYSHLVCDPDMSKLGGNDLSKQIAVLIAVLDTPRWIDFSKLESQNIAAHYNNEDPGVIQLFYHQLVLSIELHLRIERGDFDDVEKTHFLTLLPDRVAWSIALAKVWLSNVTLREMNHIRSEDSWALLPTFQVTPYDKLSRIKQVEQLGWVLKWPNMGQVCEILGREIDGETPLESSSNDAKSFFSGLILPGASASWLAMNCLIACEAKTGHKLQGLSYRHPQSGFQYRNATYWYWSSIVGKVLGAAKGVNQDAGWVGPCLYSSDLERYIPGDPKPERVHCVIVNPDPVPTRLTKQKIEDMAARSDPLGPLDEIIPVDEFETVGPKHHVVDTIRVEKLACPFEGSVKYCASDEPSVFMVAVRFAIKGATYSLRLRHDTSYIQAIPCEGTHALFWDYAYKSIPVDGLLDQICWGGVDAALPLTATAFDPIGEPGSSNPRIVHDVYDDEAVLVVEAFGVADNEVFARAWCSYMGLSAIVANIDETCMACAIREAYAASVTVVILINGCKDEDVEAVEHSPPRPRKVRFRNATV